MKQKQSKNIIWLTIQLINIIFQIISAITKTDGKEFFEDLNEILDTLKKGSEHVCEREKETETDSATLEKGCC